MAFAEVLYKIGEYRRKSTIGNIVRGSDGTANVSAGGGIMKRIKIVQWTFFLLAGFLAVGYQGTSAQTGRFIDRETFKGIVPLVTTKAEIEQKFGKANEHLRYEFDEGRVYILYNEKSYKQGVDGGLCTARENSVVSVEVEPYTTITIEELKLNKDLWRQQSAGDHLSNLIAFSNETTGVTFYVDNGNIRRASYRVPKECRRAEEK